jgi:uncharacterized protein YjiS (DUF1127 family)
MAVFDTTIRAPVISAGHITRTIANLVGVATNWNDMRVTRKQLNSLSARELEDIGLERCDIENVCSGLRR